MKKMKKIMLSILPALTFLLFCKVSVMATGILMPDVETPREGCVFLGIPGSYISEDQKALNRINAIRQEACQLGLRDPRDTSRKLTMADYKPIEWSTELEKFARVRAAESAVTVAHERTGRDSCFVWQGKYVYGAECLAWNYGTSMVSGVEQWYSEKAYWAKGDYSMRSGHYSAMIDPDNLYIGLGCFNTGFAEWPTTVCAKFASDSKYGLDQRMGESAYDCMQILEVDESYLTVPRIIFEESRLKIGKTIEVIPGYITENAFLCEVYKGEFSVSDPGIATIDQDGYLTGHSLGTAVVTFTCINGKTYTGSVPVVVATKASQNITVSKKMKTVKYALVKKKTCLTSKVAVSGAKTTVTYKKVSGSSKLSINKKTGKISIKKKTKKGTYSIKIKVTAEENSKYKAASKIVTIKVRVK